MQRLRVLSVLLPLWVAASAASARQAQPAPRPESPAARKPATPAAKPAAPAAKPAEPAGPPPQKVGEVLDAKVPLARIFPTAAPVPLLPRSGKPLVLLFWSTSAGLAREELVAFQAFAEKEKLAGRVDAIAVAGVTSDKQKHADVVDVLRILGASTLPVVVDADHALAKRLGVSQYPEYVLVDAGGKILAKGIRSLDHGHLGDREVTAAELVRDLAARKPVAPLERTWPYYPSDRLLRKKYVDAELPLFSPLGFDKGKRVRLSSLVTGQRPAVVMFFSATCDHCQVDVPQIVKFMKAHPGKFDVVGVTRIRHANHRKVSDEYFKQQGIAFPIVEDPGGVADLYKVTSTPTSFYLSPAGAVGFVTYFQHANLEKDWLERHAKLQALPAPPPASAPAKDWRFPLQLKDESGKVVDLASFAGKPTVLHFWATWCAPCRKELPDMLARLPELSKNANVVLVSVEDASDAAKVAKYRQETGLKFTTYLEPRGGLAQKIDFSRSVPRTYVLDAAGNLDTIYAGSYDWKDPDRFATAVGRLVRR